MSYGPSPQTSGAGNGGDQLVNFRLADAERIAKAVYDIEGSRRGRRGSTLPRASGSSSSGNGVTFATFDGAWSKNTYKTVRIQPANTTASAYNSTVNIAAAGSSNRRCALAVYSGVGPSGESGEYVLIMAECF